MTNIHHNINGDCTLIGCPQCKERTDKFMVKPLSQLLEEIEVTGPVDKTLNLVDRESYDRMKRVAIELANGLAHIQSKKPMCEGCSCIEISLLEHYDCVAEQSISRAKDIIGGRE